MRRCGRCGESKSVDEFAWRRKAVGQLDNYCRSGRAAYGQEHYRANRHRYILQARRRKLAVAEERMRWLVEFFRDHLGDKLFTIGTALPDRNWDAILKEMAKCEVVCANCHRRRTARRGGYPRAAVAQR